jgi:hypothetical protein
MKVTNWRYRSEIDEGISIVKVDNYNVVYRIINEIQNALEPVLTRYYELNGCLPECITRYSVVFNDEEEWKTWMEEDKTL